MRYKSIILLSLFVLAGAGLAITPPNGYTAGKLRIPSDYCFQRISDTLSDLWLVHSDRMAFGKPFQVGSPYPDDQEQVENLPYTFNANFPARTRGEYLYAAGLWVGGIKGNDTLVSHAFDYVAPVPEFNPLPCPTGAFVTQSGWADIEHIAVAYDTIILGDTLFRCQVGDCNDWYPLGVKVTSHSYTWESPPYDRSIILQYTIENIGSTPIEKGWAGIYADPDIGSLPSAFSDDISGFIDGAVDENGQWVDLDLAYAIDMDGDPGDFEFDEYSTRGAFGVEVLGLSEPGYSVNFNWWAIDNTTESDWAPRQDEPVIRDLGGSFATAYGDSNKYYVMSHPEVDYSEIEAGLNHPGWLPPSELGIESAKGKDTRFLISAGPFDLAPGEEVTFTVAFVAGDNIIENTYINMWFDPSDRRSVSDYYEVTDFGELKSSALAAAAVFREGFDLPPPGPPRNFRLAAYDDSSATFVWSKKEANDMAGYHLMRQSGEGPWETVKISAADDTTAIVAELDSDIEYRFKLASADLGGAVGKTTPEIEILTGLPHPPAWLKGNSRQTYPVLEWAHSSDADVVNYRLYRIDAEALDTVVATEIDDTVYIDLEIAAAHTYKYFVRAVDISGYESVPSMAVTLVPLTLSSGILAVNANPGNITANLVYDLDFADSMFARGLAGTGYDWRRGDALHPLTIADLSPYSLVVVSAENRSGALTGNLAQLLPVYLANGGKVILILRHAAVEKYPVITPQVITFGAASFMSRYMMLDSSYIGPLVVGAGYQLIGDLTGETPADSQMPYLHWDSLRVNQFGYGVPSGLPYCGYMWPREPAEVIYRYESSNPDSTTQGQVGGIRYKGDDYQFYLLNFPLSLMDIDSAATILKAAVADLGENFICGDVNGDLQFNIGDVVAYIRWLYHEVEPANLWQAGDVDCSGEYDLADVLILINFYSGKGLAPGCCR